MSSENYLDAANKEAAPILQKFEEQQRPLLEQMAEIQKSLKEQLADIGAKYFREASKQLFDAYPKLESFTWAQYTPYFNDGDECVFGVDTDSYSIGINGSRPYEDDEDSDEDDDDGAYYSYTGDRTYGEKEKKHTWYKTVYGERVLVSETPYKQYKQESTTVEVAPEEVPWKRRAREDISRTLDGLAKENEGFFKDTFGDHVKVTITRDGYETEEYEHD